VILQASAYRSLMPFTPFHLGPAALLKALLPRRFSFVVFCYAQIITDLEVAYYIWMRESPLHRFTHTYGGAIIVGLFCGLTGPQLHRVAAKFAERSSLKSLIVDPLPLTISVLSALIGTFSHVLLDSIKHHDIEPLWPLSGANVLQDAISLPILHLLCMSSGIAGLIWGGIIANKRRIGR